jgi:D-tyrosyl-tRNA(Tyr) deacylase
MRVVIQRVTHASVIISGNVHSSIGKGLLVLVGIEDADDDADVNWITGKIIQLRIFNDSEGVMNCSLKEINGDLLLVSQFTLHASTRKGNRPSYIRASKPDKAVPLYERLIGKLTEELGRSIHTGVFGADMQIALENDGPVTIIIDSKNKE